jgi:hypothetical protein
MGGSRHTHKKHVTDVGHNSGHLQPRLVPYHGPYIGLKAVNDEAIVNQGSAWPLRLYMSHTVCLEAKPLLLTQATMPVFPILAASTFHLSDVPQRNT